MPKLLMAKLSMFDSRQKQEKKRKFDQSLQTLKTRLLQGHSLNNTINRQKKNKINTNSPKTKHKTKPFVALSRTTTALKINFYPWSPVIRSDF